MGTNFISKSCINCCHCKGSLQPKKVPPPSPPSQSYVPPYSKLDGITSWLLNGVATVFFSSLERCSCFYLDTKDDSDDSDHTRLPLMILYDSGSKCDKRA
ncbi:hypothetical protein JCGZ_12565 [Jatropha curcas]|uniref:Uncharacterized protein n=1 Tax=Jatropha curcas TaxID=180498 RepID=A0A067KJV0_JATCU|nr:hypothetical protein JCGZ_12565 [Jatropha curcas]